jgi:membrane-bound ClpP family serine protease
MSTKVRLILAVLTSLLDELIIAAVILWGLPRLGIKIPLPALVVIMLALIVYAFFSFRMGTRILNKKPVAGLSSMVGIEGKVQSRLAPRGIVKIGSELWNAETESGVIEVGVAVIVVRQQRLSLTVKAKSPAVPENKPLESKSNL